MRRSRLLRSSTIASLALSSLALAPPAAAHTHVQVGEYELTIGWANEPTFVGQPNAVEVSVADHDGAPVNDLATGDVMVVVTSAGQSTEALPLAPAFSVDGGFGTPGVYEAELLPTSPGEYTFAFSGSINGETVEVSVTSGDDTFSEVRSTTELEFPVKVPALADVATRLDRIDGRIAALQSDSPGAQALEAALAASEAAEAAASSAGAALLVGVLVGGAGLLVGAIALALALRAGRRGTSRA